MSENNIFNKNIQLLGFLYFLFFGVLALIFYKERMLWADSAAFSLEVLQTKSFFTPLGRWGSVFSQILPLLFLKAGCSLATFLKVYSVGFMLLYYLGFLIITLLFKNNRVGLVYLLTLCLTYRNTFYFSISEFSQGLALVVVLGAMLEHQYRLKAKRKVLVLLLSFVLIFTLYFFHQLLVLGVLFVILFTYLKHQNYKKKEIIVLGVFTIMFFGVKILLLSGNSYEASKIPSLTIFLEQLPHLFELPSSGYFYYHLKMELIIPFLVAITSLIILGLKRKYLLGAFIMLYATAYFLLIIITYYKGESPSMYQQYYIMFGLFLAFLIDAVWAEEAKLEYLIICAIPLLLFSSYRIYESHHIITKRVSYLYMIVEKGKTIKNRKYIIHPDDFSWGNGWVAWAVPSETLLISSLENKDNGVVCYVPDFNEEVDTTANKGQLLSAPWQQHLLHTDILDSNYFKIPHNTNYLLLNRLSRGVLFYKSKMRYDREWREKLKIKAKERGISLNEMIEIDAEYLLNTVEEKELNPIKIKPQRD